MATIARKPGAQGIWGGQVLHQADAPAPPGWAGAVGGGLEVGTCVGGCDQHMVGISTANGSGSALLKRQQR